MSDTLVLLISGMFIGISGALVLLLIIGFGLPIEIGVIPLIIAMIIVAIIFTAMLFKLEKHKHINLRGN